MPSSRGILSFRGENIRDGKGKEKELIEHSESGRLPDTRKPETAQRTLNKAILLRVKHEEKKGEKV